MKNHASLNRIYRLVWSDVLNAWVAVAETCRGFGKGGSRKSRRAITALAIAALPFGAALADPTGGQVTAGSATISQSTNLTTINQATQNASLSWQTFNVGANQTVNFVQPNSTAIAINRIYDTNGSQIMGNINANGKVFLINPNGILFGQGAQVNVGGLIASTLNMSDESLNSAARSFSGTGTGSIINKGTINTPEGGYVAFLGNTVSNQGTINSPLGTVALGAGSAATLTFDNNSLVQLQIDQSTLDNLAENKQLIKADGGMVLMSAGAKASILASVVNNTGIIEARTVQNKAGVITLMGSMTAGTTNVAGKLDASAPNGGNGGFIETSAAHVKIADTAKITTLASAGSSGTWLIDPYDFTIGAAIAGGDITGENLGKMLDFNSVKIQTTLGTSDLNNLYSTKPGNGDINVNEAVNWSSNTTLTLEALRNITFNQSITATGNTAGLNLSSAALFKAGSSATLSGLTPSLKIGAKDYIVVNKLGIATDAATATASSNTLQGMAADVNMAGNYALGSNIFAGDTATWNANAGFKPIGRTGTLFTGMFDGLGHTITNLRIYQPSIANIGLFGAIDSAGASVRSVGLIGANVTGGGGTGALVGSIVTGMVAYSYAMGSVSGGAGTGGLVGSNISGAIFGSYSTGSVVGAGGSGGLVGSTTSGSVTDSYSSSSVDGAGAAGIGGLVGSTTSGAIVNSYATGNVIGAAGTGGLVGSASGPVSFSYSTGVVSGAGAGHGGLVGSTTSTVSNSFWDAQASGLAVSTGGGTPLTTAQMKDKTLFGGLDFNNTWFMYSGYTAPLLQAFMTPLTVTAKNAIKTYDGVAFSGNGGVTYSTAPNNNLLGNLTYSGSALNAINVIDSGTSIVAGGLYSNQAGYMIDYKPGTLTIKPTALSVVGSRTYDGNTNLNAGNIWLNGVVDGQTLSLSGVGSLDKNVGLDKSVNLGDPLLTGLKFTDGVGTNRGLASNYTFTGGTHLANISAAAITLASNDVSKVYDSGLSATSTAKITSGTLFGNDNISGGTFAYTDKNASATANKTVTTTGVTVGDGTNNANYNITYANNTTSSISKAAISISTTDVVKVYDTNTSALGHAVATSGLYASDTISGGSFAFTDVNAGNNKTVTVAGVSITDGNNGGNYSVSYVDNTTSTIKAANLTVLNVNNTVAHDKIYDGTAIASLTDGVLVGILNSDEVFLTQAGFFASKNVGLQAVTANDSLYGAKAGNYNISQPTGLMATINAKNLTVTATANNKFYDALTGATVTLADNRIANDVLTLSNTAASFSDKNAANGKTVNVAGISVTGTDAGNYTFNTTASTNANITPKALTASVASSTKIYDGNTLATAPVLTITSGLVGLETVTATGTASLNTKDVATANTVTVNTVTLANGTNGGLASNYSLAAGEQNTASVSATTLTVKANAASRFVTQDDAVGYNGVSFTGFKGGDTVADLNGSLVVTRARQFVDVAAGSYSNALTASGLASRNYNFDYNTKGSFNIIAANQLLVNVANISSIYGSAFNYIISSAEYLDSASNTIKTLTGTNSGNTFTYTDGVGGGAIFTLAAVNNVTSAGGNTVVGNYAVTATTPTIIGANFNSVVFDGNLSVTQRSVAVSATGVSKVYDGNTSMDTSNLVLTGKMTGDILTTSGTGSFDAKNAGTNLAYTLNNLALAGNDVGNYYLGSGTSMAGNDGAITQKALTATVSATSKVYDGNTSATPILTLSGLINGEESITATGTATFNSKNVTASSTITVNTSTLHNGTNSELASNYSLATGQTASIANAISKATLTLTALTDTKTYDGNTNSSGAVSVTGLVGGDSIASTTQSFASKNVLGSGGSSLVVNNGFTLTDGNSGGNYAVRKIAATGTIDKLAVTIAAPTTSKVYDGSTTYTASAADFTSLKSSLVGGDSVTAAAMNYTDKNAGDANKSVALNSVTIADTNSGGNYTVTLAGNSGSTITKADLTLNAVAGTKTYDGNTSSTGVVTETGLVAGEALVASQIFNNQNVVGATALTVKSGYTITDSGNADSLSNYNITSNDATGNITAKALTATATATDKVYNGDNIAAATLTIDSAGFVGTEAVTATNAATFSSKNVIANNTVTVNSNTLANGTNGGLASNYSLATGQTVTGQAVTTKALTASATANDKTYDGTTTAAATLAITNGLVSGETVTATGGATFNTKDVATANLVTVNSTTLADGTNGLASNYSLGFGQTATAHITQSAVGGIISMTGTRTYDGTVDVSAGLFTLTGMYSGESLGLTGTGTVASKNVGTYDVNLSGLTLTDGINGLASNYTFTNGSQKATITQANLTLNAVTGSKTYDGNTSSSGVVGHVGLFGSDTLVASQVYSSQNVVGTNGLIIDSGYSVTDTTTGNASAGNYNITSNGATGNITAKALTATATASDKVYNGDNIATAALTITTGLVGTETVTATNAATFSSKNVIANNTVTVNSNTLVDGTNGGLASNYSLVTGQTAAAKVTAKALTATATATDKVYNGDNVATATLAIATGLVGSETVTATGLATFTSKDVIANNTVTVNSNTLANGTNGGLASNYSLAIGQTVTGKAITTKALTANASAIDKVYNGDNIATADLTITTGLVGTETVTATNAATFSSKDVIANNTVTVNSNTLANGTNGGLASNYSLATGQTVTGKAITQKALTATATASDKVYNGDNIATAALTITTGLVGTETVTATNAATFSSKNVIANNTVTVNSNTLANGTNGGLASNYNLSTGQTVTGKAITAKALTITGITAANKTYDQTTNATVNTSSALLTGLIINDHVAITATGLFADKMAANNKTVTLTSAYTGGDVGNYLITDQATTTANIAQKALTVTAIAANRDYNGSTVATVNSLSDNRIGGDAFDVTNISASFADKNVATGKVLSIKGITLSGADASNYNVNTTAAATANITRLASVTWTGGSITSNSWFDPANWTNGAVPDLSNVANVVIPTGYTVDFNSNTIVPLAKAGTVNVDSIGSAGNMSMTAGTLNVKSSLQLAALSQAGGDITGTGNIAVNDFAQTNGTITNNGNFTVANAFSQTAPGTIAVGGNIDINQAVGDLSFNSLVGNNINLKANNGAATLGNIAATGTLNVTALNNITQTANPGAVVVGGITTLSSNAGDITLTNPANVFTGIVNATGRSIKIGPATGTTHLTIDPNAVASTVSVVNEAIKNIITQIFAGVAATQNNSLSTATTGSARTNSLTDKYSLAEPITMTQNSSEAESTPLNTARGSTANFVVDNIKQGLSVSVVNGGMTLPNNTFIQNDEEIKHEISLQQASNIKTFISDCNHIISHAYIACWPIHSQRGFYFATN